MFSAGKSAVGLSYWKQAYLEGFVHNRPRLWGFGEVSFFGSQLNESFVKATHTTPSLKKKKEKGQRPCSTTIWGNVMGVQVDLHVRF